MPAFEKTYAERTEAIEGGLEAAETKQAEADAKLAELEQQLADARHEAARIREEAREQGAQIIAEMREQAQAESAPDRRARQGPDRGRASAGGHARCGPRSARWRPASPVASSASAWTTRRVERGSSTGSSPSSRRARAGSTDDAVERPPTPSRPCLPSWRPVVSGSSDAATVGGGPVRGRRDPAQRARPAPRRDRRLDAGRGQGRPGRARSSAARSTRRPLELVEAAVGRRWTAGRDLADALEQIGVVAVVKAADAERPDALADELFAVGQVVKEHPGAARRALRPRPQPRGQAGAGPQTCSRARPSGHRAAGRAGPVRLAPHRGRRARRVPADRRRACRARASPPSAWPRRSPTPSATACGRR